MPVLLTIPMVLFILPCVFLIIGGPSALRLMDIFHH
jgi:tight adherence protein C